MRNSSIDINEAKRLLGAIGEPDRKVFNQLAQSPSFEVKALLYDKIYDMAPPFVHLDQAEVDSFCIDFLLSSFKNNSRRDDNLLGNEYSRGEAAWALAMWFKTLLNNGNEYLLFKMRDELAELWRHGDAKTHEVILTHILEHVLDVDRLRELFKPWLTDPELAPAYVTGVEYAKNASAVHSQSQQLPGLSEKDPKQLFKNALEYLHQFSDELTKRRMETNAEGKKKVSGTENPNSTGEP